MAHIHFAWELGGGLGHAGRLKPLAQEALARGHRVSLCLRELVHTDALLRDLNAPRFQAPIFLHQVRGVPMPEASLAEILMTCGYLNADALRGLFTGWHSLLSELKPDLVVADYSPTALLAARSLGIPSAALGIGFFIPPDSVPMPSIRSWEPIHPGRLAAADSQLLASVNTVLAQYGTAALQRASQVMYGDAPLLLTWPELDHYGRDVLPAGQRWWGPSMSPHTGLAPQWPPSGQPDPSERPALSADLGGSKVFAYLKSEHPDHALVLQALVKLGCRTVCYMPDVAMGKPPPVISPLISYSKGPVDLASTLPGCELCVCHGGEATLAQALLAGVPLLLMPTQVEQFLISQRVAQTGGGINAAAQVRPLDYVAVVASLLGNSDCRTKAQAFAARYAGFTPRQHTLDLVDAFERQLAMT